MYKKLSALSLLAPLLLVGCGTADVDGLNPDEEIDTQPPELTAVLINGKSYNAGSITINATLSDIYLYSVDFVFNEAIDTTPITNSGTLKGGTTPVSGSWSYDANTFTLTFIPSNTKLTYNVSGTVTLDENIADLQGNRYLDAGAYVTRSVSYATQNSLNATVTVNGLLSNGSLSIKLDNPDAGFNETLTFDTIENSKTFTNVPLANGHNYTVTTANDKQICQGGGSFTMGLNAPNITITCSDVTPFYAKASYWNDWLNGTADINGDPALAVACTGTDCFHGGIYRAYETTDTVSCDGLTISDKLGVFNWTCLPTTNNSIKAISTGFVDGKGLRDLIKVTLDGDNLINSTAEWLPNQVVISGVLQKKSVLSVWWPNSISLTSSGILNTDKHVYVYSGYVGVSQLYIQPTSSNNISLVVSPDEVLDGNVSLQGNHNHLWLEGDFIGKADNEPAIMLASTDNALLHNVSIQSSKGVGLELKSTTATRNQGKLQITNAALDGLKITAGDKNRLKNVHLTHNGDNGLLILSNNKNNGTGAPDNILEELHSDNNQGHGIKLHDAQNNHIIFSSATSNQGDGLHFSYNTDTYGASFNYIAQFSSINNRGNGINATDFNIFYNSINGAFVALNQGSGIAATNTYGTDNPNDPPALKLQSSTLSHNATGDCLIDGVDNCPVDQVTVNNSIDLSTVFVGPNAGTTTTVIDWQAAATPHLTWVSSTTDLSTTPSAPTADSCNTSCMLMDWSLTNPSVPGQNNGTSALFVYGVDSGGTPLGVFYQPAMADLISDNLDNDDGLCELTETCSAASTIGHYQMP